MDASTAVSSTADAGTSSALIASLSAEDRTTWRMTGALPTTTTDPAVIAAPATAEPAAQAASTEVSPKADPEPADDLKPKTKARIDALLADRKAAQDRADALERELAALKAPKPAPAEPPAASATATGTREDAQRLTPDLTKPALTDVEFVEQFPEATYGDYSRYVVRYELAQDRQATVQQTEAQRRQSTFAAQVATELKANPQWVSTLDPRVAGLVPTEHLPQGQAPTALNRIAQEVFESSQATALMRHLSEHPAEIDRIASLPPDAIVRAMARLEGTLSAGPVKPEVKPLPVSQAVPLETLGRKPAVDGDPVSAALARGDFRGYREAQNARELAAAGR